MILSQTALSRRSDNNCTAVKRNQRITKHKFSELRSRDRKIDMGAEIHSLRCSLYVHISRYRLISMFGKDDKQESLVSVHCILTFDTFL